MKKNFIYLCMLIAVTACVSSCSKNKNIEKLLKHIPANIDEVSVGDIGTIVESAGSSIKDGQIKIAADIESSMPSDFSKSIDRLNDEMSEKGLSTKGIAEARKSGEYRMEIYPIENKDKFHKWLRDEDYEEVKEAKEHGVSFYAKKNKGYYNDYEVIAFDSEVAIQFYNYNGDKDGDETDAVKPLAKVISKAHEENILKTDAGAYLCKSNTGGVYVKLADQIDDLRYMGINDKLSRLIGSMVIKGELNKENAVVNFKLFDKSGNNFSKDDLEDLADLVDLDAKINSDALAYFSQHQNLVVAASLQSLNFKKLFSSDNSFNTLINNYVGKLGGTVAFGFGLKGGLKDVMKLSTGSPNPSLFDLTVVMEAKDGNASSLLSDFKQLLSSGRISYTGSGDKLQIDFPGKADFKIYVEAQQKFLVISTSPVAKSNESPAVKELKGTDKLLAGALSLPGSHALLKDLEISQDISASFEVNLKKLEAEFKISIVGGKKKGFIANALDVYTSSLLSNEKKLNSMMEEVWEESRQEYIKAEDTAVVIEEEALYDFADSAAVVEPDQIY